MSNEAKQRTRRMALMASAHCLFSAVALLTGCQTAPVDDYAKARASISEQMRMEIGTFIFDGEYQRQMAAAGTAMKATNFVESAEIAETMINQFNRFQSQLGEYSDLVALWKIAPLYYHGMSLYWNGERSQRTRDSLGEAIGIASRAKAIVELWRRTGGGVTDEVKFENLLVELGANMQSLCSGAYKPLAVVCLELGDPEHARTYYRWACTSDDDGSVHNSFAWELCVCANPSFADPKAALPIARQAVKLDGTNPAYLDTLAVALGLNGLLDEAVATEEKAIALLDDPEKTTTYKKTLELLRSGEFSAADFR